MIHHRVLDQDKVLAAACDVVKAEGIQALTYRRLAHDLNIRSQSLYNYFPNLEGLIETMGTHFMQALYQQLTEALTGVAGIEALRVYAQTAHDYFDGQGNLFEVLYYVHRYDADSPFVQATAQVLGMLKKLINGVRLKTMHHEAFTQGLISSVLGFTVIEIMGLIPSPAPARRKNFHQMLGLYLGDVITD
ncbi:MULTISPECIES: TetR/AcrR family transcriptional regulator [Lacticaseibacillus]|uniref:TetR/AcrR family transcriptional regulator n=2 Tax=Lacticaseibacillus TaxID=2759736 RepID=A0ABW4CGQ4_9LACO|nr:MULTISPECIES: TetR/AcrR family transcriptional regulator [Lacticaseibacillus]